MKAAIKVIHKYIYMNPERESPPGAEDFKLSQESEEVRSEKNPKESNMLSSVEKEVRKPGDLILGFLTKRAEEHIEMEKNSDKFDGEIIQAELKKYTELIKEFELSWLTPTTEKYVVEAMGRMPIYSYGEISTLDAMERRSGGKKIEKYGLSVPQKEALISLLSDLKNLSEKK